jgi:hypothetical protein
MFTNKETGATVYADLNQSVSTATLRTCDLVRVFLDVIRDTPEHRRLKLEIPPHALENEHDEWWDEKGADLLLELFDVLDSYAPEGYIFGSLPDDGADFGFWNENED